MIRDKQVNLLSFFAAIKMMLLIRRRRRMRISTPTREILSILFLMPQLYRAVTGKHYKSDVPSHPQSTCLAVMAHQFCV